LKKVENSRWQRVGDQRRERRRRLRCLSLLELPSDELDGAIVADFARLPPDEETVFSQCFAPVDLALRPAVPRAGLDIGGRSAVPVLPESFEDALDLDSVAVGDENGLVGVDFDRHGVAGGLSCVLLAGRVVVGVVVVVVVVVAVILRDGCILGGNGDAVDEVEHRVVNEFIVRSRSEFLLDGRDAEELLVEVLVLQTEETRSKGGERREEKEKTPKTQG